MVINYNYFYLLVILLISDITNNTKNTKNNILAIPAAAPAIPPKPNTAATIATIKKMIVQRNIIFKFFGYTLIYVHKVFSDVSLRNFNLKC